MLREHARRTTGRQQMVVLTPRHPICQLATRASNRIEVTLLWNRRSDHLRVGVNDSHTGVYFELRAARDDALDVFRHPSAYTAPRDIGPASASDTEQPLRLAA
jgi:hypothetical protein